MSLILVGKTKRMPLVGGNKGVIFCRFPNSTQYRNGRNKPWGSPLLIIQVFFYSLFLHSSAALANEGYRGVWKEKSAIIINLIGFIIIVPFAMAFINLGLPGAMYMIEESPSLKTIFEFPMALAPTLVVPIFAMVNLFVVLRLMKRLREKQGSAS